MKTIVIGTCIALAVLKVCILASAQEPACIADIPALVTLPDASLVKRLGTDSFVAYSKQTPVRIDSIETHLGARRILFVVETGKHVPPAARTIERDVVSDILKADRREDSFALLTARGPRREIGFGAAKETLISAVTEIAAGLPGKNQETGVLDALFEAVEWFHPPAEGDAIIVLTMGIESSHRTSYAKVRDSLVNTQVRLFGIQLGPIIAGSYGTGITAGLAGNVIPTAWVDPNRENLFVLSRDTGGFAAVENAAGTPQKQYKLSDERLSVVRYIGRQEYKAVVEYYGVRIQRPPPDLRLELADSVRNQLPGAMLSFARNLRCSVNLNSSSQ